MSRSSTRKPRRHISASEWKTLRGSFIHVSLLSNAALCDFAPGGGLSKYAHLGDGNIDIILVEPVSRRDFYRFLRRHTNTKNQLALPFVKWVRTSEARIRILNTLPTSHSVEPALDDRYISSKPSPARHYLETVTKSPKR